jgi:HEAT repeat protein
MHGASQDMNRELHNPAGMAKLGVTEGAAMLLGPFGFGITAIEYMRKNGATSARATAIDLLSQNWSPDVRSELIDALSDKDPAVRAAAAKALGQRHDPTLAKPVGVLFADSKLPVRLTAAAAYINCSGRSSRRRR